MNRRFSTITAEALIQAVGLAVLTFFALIAISRAYSGPPPIGWTTPAKIIRVIDGDTVEVEITRRLNVRLDDCWAPESRTKDLHEKQIGLAAKANLEDLLNGHSVTLYIPAGDRENISDIFTFSRVVGTLWTDDDSASINQRQIEQRFAWPTKAEQKAAVEESRNPKPRKAKP